MHCSRGRVGRESPVRTRENAWRPGMVGWISAASPRSARVGRTGRIRATHYQDFSDKQELNLGVRLLLDAVKQHSIEPSDREYCDFLVEAIEGFGEERLSVYVLSLTELQDSAHHWQEYAPGGAVIGFCRDRIEKGFPIDISRRISGMKVDDPVRPDPANRFMQCRYVSTFDLPELISRRFFTANSYPAGFRNPHARANSFIYAGLSVSIYQTICAIKNPNFFADAEWRCFHINPDAEDYPIKTENNREFIELQFTPADFVREIWIGSHDRRQECEDAIQTLRKKGLLRCDATMSKLTTSSFPL